jgi:hypothetical protein
MWPWVRGREKADVTWVRLRYSVATSGTSLREERRESERSLQSFKEWVDVVVVSAPCKLLICINIAVLLG